MCVCLFVSYVQVDPTGSGRVAAGDAALFLKRSALADLVLGKVGTDPFTRGEYVLSVSCELCFSIDLGFGRL